MTNDTQVTTQDTQDTPKVTPKAKVTRDAKQVRFSTIHVKFAAAKGIDVTRAAKLNRSYVRSNFDAIAKQWPELRKSQKVNRDSNRYPEMIPAKLADAIVKRSVAPLKH
jgi:hypothetical protein